MADTADSTVETTEATTETTETTLDDPGKKALDAERKARRDAERELKTMRTELATLQQANLSEQEQAVAAARAEGLVEGTKSASARLVAAEMKAAAAGRLEADQMSTLLNGVNQMAFLDDDGEVDLDKVSKFIDGIAPAVSVEAPQPAGFPDLGQGSRGGAVTASPGADFAKFLTGQLKN